ncbi:MAG: SulP family inorganic anion transporter, partial [Myxococcota bacterium]
LLLLALKRWNPRFPGALTVVVLGTGLVAALGLHDKGVGIVGDVPQGLPAPSMPTLSWALIEQMAPIALAISLVGFMESISVAKAFARKNRYEIDANRELVGLGVANIAGALFQGYPVTGGFSRTAVNGQAGAKTGLASLITAAVIALTLLLLTPLFYYLPKAVLAAIIMVAVFGLVDVAEVKHLYQVKKSDLALLLTTFVATLTLGIEAGIGVGVGASLLAVIFRTTRPHTAVLGRIPGTHVYRNVERHPEAETFDGVLVVRVDAQFYFGNVTFLKETLQRLVRESSTPVRAVVINAATINHLDSSADSALQEIVADFRDQGIEMFFANVRGPVMEVMKRSKLEQLVGPDHFEMSVTRAVTRARAHVASSEPQAGQKAAQEPESDRRGAHAQPALGMAG